MLTYKAAYTLTDGVYIGEVLDFPGTVTYGRSMEEARGNLSSALRDMAETNLLSGEPLPLPNSTCTDPDADIEEPIYLLLSSASRVMVVPQGAVA